MEPARYQPRPLSYLGVESIAGYLLKIYSIRHPDQPLDRERFATRGELIAASLPQPADTDQRPAVQQ